MDKYCDIVDIENLLLKEIEDNFEGQVESWIKAVSRIMDTMANRRLVAPAVGSGEDNETMYFDGDGSRKLLIGDCQEVEEVQIGDLYGDNMEIVSATDYVVSPKTPPISSITLKYDYFTCGIQNVAVKGRFGLFAEIPDDIRLACSYFVAMIINSQDKGNMVKTSETIGNYSVAYSDKVGEEQYNQAVATVNAYRHIKF